MPTLKPFKAVRPHPDLVSDIAALPYDVYQRKEAKEIVAKNSLSFLKIDRPETQFPNDFDMYSQEAYDKAKSTLKEMISDGSFVRDEKDCYYIYALTMNGRTQTGLVGCASIDDYLNDHIKKHEETRPEKEVDRIRHVDVCNAQTGPIFLAYPSVKTLNDIIANAKKETALYDFISDDGIRHQVWTISDNKTIEKITDLYSKLDSVYIADGHHRAASAVKVGLKRREENPTFTGKEEFNFFLTVLFPADELKIFDYNRVVEDLNGHSVKELLDLIGEKFEIGSPSPHPYHPQQKGEFGLYVEGNWYPLTVKSPFTSKDVVDGIDASILEHLILTPLLGIPDVKTDSRIKFVGGIRGLEFLQKTVDEYGGVAFSMYPTTMDELFAVADAKRLMPAKSTWFEPKLRSGLLIHEI